MKNKVQNKKIIKEAMDLTDDARDELLRQGLAVQTAVLKMFQYASVDLKNAELTAKIKKMKAYMENLTDYISGSADSIDDSLVDTKIPLEHGGHKEGITGESVKKSGINLIKEFNSLDKESSTKSELDEVSLYKSFGPLVEKLNSYQKPLNKELKESAKSYYNIVTEISSSRNIKSFNQNFNKLYEWANKNKVKILTTNK